jgi:hypothetical protein
LSSIIAEFSGTILPLRSTKGKGRAVSIAIFRKWIDETQRQFERVFFDITLKPAGASSRVSGYQQFNSDFIQFIPMFSRVFRNEKTLDYI